MNLKSDWKLMWRAAPLAVALALGACASIQPSERTLKGTGNYSATVTRAIENLQPSCVELATRQGQVAFSGFITNAAENGHLATVVLQDSCAKPVQGTFRTEYRLKDASAGGLRGDVTIKVDGVFELAPSAGFRSRGYGTVVGTSGGLAGAKGTIQVLSQATPTTSVVTYYVEIHPK